MCVQCDDMYDGQARFVQAYNKAFTSEVQSEPEAWKRVTDMCVSQGMCVPGMLA